MRKIVFLISMLLVFSSFLYSQTAKYSNEFLSLGVGARGLALANTMTALSADATAAYWNPAGLGRMDRRYQLAMMHSEYFAGIANYDYAGVALKIDDRSSVAFTYIRFGVDDIMNTTQLIDNQGNIDYDRISYFSAADNAFLLSYAYSFANVKGLYLGANAKVIHRKMGNFAGSWGFGLDAGLQYENKGWQAALMLRDVTSTFNAWHYSLTPEMEQVFLETGNELPQNGLELTMPKLSLGGGKYVEFGKGFNATFAIDFDFTFDGKRNLLVKSNILSMDPHFGMEFAYKKIVALRAGIGNFQQEVDFDMKKKTTCQISLGVGVGIKNFCFIDYAFTDIGDLSGALYSHVFSIRLAVDNFKRKK